ncbi:MULTISPECIES: NAD(P)/FAD-dependent oxidoreductase [unclassified Arthrobacter]|uniref:NAD(P)/FAD-dependent oxidoreductase n=1 Tax=unclassified Arthrobacter TaxID=235627 RepID=UPI002105B46B|nr:MULTISPECIES: NAD(P)/FAD-dependent oxidoreductase [unclassified Arthrobacter]MCQ1945896.1 NAD(P)/FAD-dependent oxidoreductase [Arthrobacter sp. zg-Y1116]MCQ1994426.1 NAD(P)/FAD-dependent oxidoreductase [Arthrobacter sp. zg-Y1171]UWX81484.1 NAD(P)/FAD-dependent oxidoreductase [Arthrobacter sp. zg-Y1171]
MTSSESSPAAPEYDVVIVGGGIAGLTAALVLGRARRRVVVLDAGSPRNAPAGHVHGFPTRDGMPPAELLELARAEVRGYGVELAEATVAAVEPSGTVRTGDGGEFRGRQLILATGLRDVLPDIEGLHSRWGRDVLQCPYCHGYETIDKKLAVLGTGETSIQQAQLVRSFSEHVVLVLHGDISLSEEDASGLAAMGIRVVDGTVAELSVENDALAALVLADGQTVPCEALFLEPAAEMDTGLTEYLEVDDDGCIVTDEMGRTSQERIWAVGNATDPSAQVVAAAGDAYRLAVVVNAKLLEEDLGLAVAAARPAAGMVEAADLREAV